jgi:hypothetical protein
VRRGVRRGVIRGSDAGRTRAVRRQLARFVWLVIAAAGPAAIPAALAGQASVVDAGSFTIVHGTAKIGREEFTIRRAPDPDNGFLLSGTAVYADRRLTPTLATDSAGAPLRYQVEVRSAERRQELLTLQIVRGHASQRTQTPHGESATEFRVADGARLLDDDVYNQYYLITRGVMSGRSPTPGLSETIRTVVPHRSSESVERITVVGDDSVMVGGHLLDATRLRLTAPSVDREVWCDALGRVLKVAIPARDLVATRDDAPQ